MNQQQDNEETEPEADNSEVELKADADTDVDVDADVEGFDFTVGIPIRTSTLGLDSHELYVDGEFRGSTPTPHILPKGKGIPAPPPNPGTKP